MIRVSLPSPNHGERRGTDRPSLIVLHYTAMGSCAEARERLCDPEAEVSAHWLIDADGTTEQLVDESRRAWHAGAGSWDGADDVNSRSIGIELANPGDRPFPEPQMAALELLLEQIMARWSIGPNGVIGHSDMAPGRKSDPGPRFDWKRLALQGLASWDETAATPKNLAALGYSEGTSDQKAAAWRLRFAPWT